MDHNSTDTMAQAQTRQATLVALNPGTTFVIVPLHPETETAAPATPAPDAPTMHDCAHANVVGIVDEMFRYRCTDCGTQMISVWQDDTAQEAPEAQSEPESQDAPEGHTEEEPYIMAAHREQGITAANVNDYVPLTPLRTCDHTEVITTDDRIFRYRCVQCDTTMTHGALPEHAAISEARTEAETIPHTEEEDTKTAPTWTSAPEQYDGFGTMTVQPDCGVYCGRTIREVWTPLRHLTWQRLRYASGLHTVADGTEWQAIQASPAYQRDNAPQVDAEGPVALILDTAGDAAMDATPAVPAPTPPAAPPAPSTASPAFTAKVQAIFDLVAQGEDAVAAALRRGTVQVRVPRAHAAGPPRATSTPRNPNAVSPRQAGFLLTRASTGTFGPGTQAVRRELFRKGVIVTDTDVAAALTPKGETLLADLRATCRTPAALAS
jgi:hypothetical protein